MTENLENFLEAFQELKERSELLEIILRGFDPYNCSVIAINEKLNYKIRQLIKFDDSE